MAVCIRERIDGIKDVWFRPEGSGWSSTLVGAASRCNPSADLAALDEGSIGTTFTMVARSLRSVIRAWPIHRCVVVGPAPPHWNWCPASPRTLSPIGLLAAVYQSRTAM